MSPASFAARAAGVVGLVAHAAVFFWYVISGLAVPAWAVGGLLAVWAALLVVAIRLWRRRPALIPLVPLAAVVLWFAVVGAGDAWLDWTA